MSDSRLALGCSRALSGSQFEALEDRVQLAEARVQGGMWYGRFQGSGEGLAPGSWSLDWPEDSVTSERGRSIPGWGTLLWVLWGSVLREAVDKGGTCEGVCRVQTVG